MKLLVVGAGGLVGRHTAKHFRAVGEPTVTASHAPGADVRVDLNGDDDTDLAGIDGVSHALVCSGITNIDTCRLEPDRTWAFNVARTIALLSRLQARGIVPIYCSSDLVFRGDSGGYTENDACEPTTEYGRQKRAVERFLIGGNATPFLIIRMSKLYSREPGDRSPIGVMLDAARRGETVRAADDQVVSPTYAEDIPRAILALVRAGASGVYHVSAPERYTRYSLAVHVLRFVGAEHLVERCSMADLRMAEARPLDNSLDSARFVARTSFTFTSLDDGLREILQRA